MALGAGFGNIAALVYRGVLLPSCLGLVTGIVAARGLTRLLGSLLFGVGANDPQTLTLAGGALLAIAVFAAAGPAFHAASTDPARVLGRE
jgi:ABC-type antimicrobial peptide transport system permease subunit